MHSFLPTPISESRWALKKITRVGFSGLNQGFGGKQGVLFSSPNHWLDCRLIPWKWLTQESWYRKSTCLWWNCLHFLCADCRPRLVQSVLPCRYLDLWPVPWDTPSPPVLFFFLIFLSNGTSNGFIFRKREDKRVCEGKNSPTERIQ